MNVTECTVEKDSTGATKPGCGAISLYNRIQIKEHRIFVSCRMTKRMEAMKANSLDGPDLNEKNTEEKEFTALAAYTLFDKIDPHDAAMMGFTESKPKDLMIYSLLVCPPQLRPVVEMNPEKKAEDSITVFYNYILACSNEVKKNKKDGKELMYNEQRGRIRALEIQVASIMQKVDAKKATGTRLKVKQNSKEVKSFSERLKGKEGRFRQHLMGKRVDFSARSVISPDSNLALDELGVPQKVALAMTFPEEITELNINRIRKLYEQGRILHLLKPTQDRKRYEPVQLKDPESFNRELTYGVIVERCLQDGDFVLFNRQPTLHRMSMMGHRVRILPYNTFRLNLSVCAPYNADFDGDEMNMHVPQNYETLAEIKHIAHVPRQIVTPKNNQPVMGMVQDALLGIFLFTLR
ncbi:MAG: hypothetical protein JST59_01170 [Actinobacteria bacterium]|nr:hypothetical protein [Actinomycetota bacterium]